VSEQRGVGVVRSGGVDHERVPIARGFEPEDEQLDALGLRIGTVGFEPTASASQRQRSTRLSYVPLRPV
jgi:hypothetical protein